MEEMYKEFLDRGDLFEIMPEAKGVWAKDKKEFTQIYDELEEWQ